LYREAKICAFPSGSELLKLGNQGLLQVGLAEPRLLAEPSKFEYQRILDQVRRLADFLSLLGQCHYPRLVPAQSQALEEQRVNLPLHRRRALAEAQRWDGTRLANQYETLFESLASS
jgi:hypothetical protein